MNDPVEIVAGFDRPNIRLEVSAFQDAAAKERFVVERAAVEEKPGILYAGTRKAADGYAEQLSELGLAAASYHAGLSAAERREAQDRFSSGELDVVVATSAFGMGIDKADVRFVLHASVPGSLDAYYQEIGRAGRDGAPARAILAYRSQDLGLQRFFATGAPDADALRRVAAFLRGEGAAVSATRLRAECDIAATALSAVLNLLEETGAVRTGRDGSRYVGTDDDVDAVVRSALAVHATHVKLERSRVDMMRGYAEATDCRRRFLLGYFGDSGPVPCGGATTARGRRPSGLRTPDGPARRPHGNAVGPGPVPAPPPRRIPSGRRSPTHPTTPTCRASASVTTSGARARS